MINPLVEYESLKAINDMVGGKLCSIDNAQDENFVVIANKLAQYRFKLADAECCFRFGKEEEDISGYYLKQGTAFKGGKLDHIQYNQSEDARLARWFTADGQYVFIYANKEIKDKDFKKMIEGLYESTR